MSKRTQIIITVIGVLLVCIGLFMPVPSKELTTYSFMADEGYSVIEEYVGGDAYNYIIGASLVGGEIAGAKAQKAIYTVAGLIFISAGLVLSDLRKASDAIKGNQIAEEEHTADVSEDASENLVVKNTESGLTSL